MFYAVSGSEEWVEVIPDSWFSENMTRAIFPKDNCIRRKILENIVGTVDDGWEWHDVTIKSKGYINYKDACDFARAYCNKHRDTEADDSTAEMLQTRPFVTKSPTPREVRKKIQRPALPAIPTATPKRPRSVKQTSFSTPSSAFDASERILQSPSQPGPSVEPSLPEPSIFRTSQFQANLPTLMRQASDFLDFHNLEMGAHEGLTGLVVLLIREVAKLRSELHQRRDAPSTSSELTLHACPLPRPLETMDEYHAFVKKLDEGNFRDEMVSQLASISCTGVDDTVRRMINILLTPLMQTGFNRSGRPDPRRSCDESGHKFPFSKSLEPLVKAAVRSMPDLAKEKDAGIENRIRRYLKDAKRRIPRSNTTEPPSKRRCVTAEPRRTVVSDGESSNSSERRVEIVSDSDSSA